MNALPLRVLRFVGGVVAAGAMSLLALRWIVPSALEGTRGGVTGFFGWLCDRHPLVLGVVLFVAIAETARYWLRRRGTRVRFEVANATPARASRALIVGLVVFAIAAFFVRSSVIASYRVVGPSMLPTLEMGDRVLVDRTAYGLRLPFARHPIGAKVPARGDLVVFTMSNGVPGGTGPQAVVKRVVGVPGDTVAFDAGIMFLNGQPVHGCDAGPYVDFASSVTVRGRLVVEHLGDLSYLTVRKPLEQPFPAYMVKQGEVFVIGDDRGMSTDSRVWSEGHGGGVPIDALEGKVTRVLLGARPDGRLDFSRVLAPALSLEVRIPNVDTTLTKERIDKCLTAPPPAPPVQISGEAPAR
ncbi:MAG TPA: signal peptidase I [Polyangia bacterium]|nr:signal peptidase I [Polyangia bacterium]